MYSFFEVFINLKYTRIQIFYRNVKFIYLRKPNMIEFILLTNVSSKILEPAIWCMFLGISMQSQIPMKMTQCLKNEYGEGCSLDRKQKTSKKEKLSKEKWFISLFRSQRFCEKIFWLPGVSNGNMMVNADQREYDIMSYKI